MIIIDANILLYAYDSSSSHHQKARQWIERTLSSEPPVGLPWQSVVAFLRIMTNPRFPGQRFTVLEVADVVEQWLEQPNVQLLSPTENHWSVLRHMMIEGQAHGPLISDAQIAALTIEYGGVLHTTDRDFTRFPKLRWTNPLA
jgi:uncharacterized protein